MVCPGLQIERKVSMVGFCSGTIAGLVAATPASGYIPTWAAVVLGITVGTLSNYGTKLKFFLRIDDALDLGAEHAIGGIIGLLFNGLFADTSLIALDNVNTSVPGGWIEHNWKQLYIQIAYICAAVAYTFVVTAILAKGLDMIPLLRLRSTAEEEALGMDDIQIGEFANDYVEVRRDYTDWTPAYDGAVPVTPTAAGDRHGKPEISASRDGISKGPQVNGNGTTNGGANGGLPPISEKPGEVEESDIVTP
ncbi:hypothetical protein QCA50_001417 [Cerrena zonata]|uniref:Ammonium transporter AmtB-like domain-containing protein n=1 Tax=Cerrena zonata TaxID=2478898 RepID=A0AAW0GNK7_9APHY